MLEIFVAKCSTDGKPEWLNKVTNISGHDMAEQISVDDSSNLYFIGKFLFESQFDTLPIVNADIQDLFITQYDTSGYARWIRQGSADYSAYHNYGSGFAIDDNENIFIVGWYSDTLEFPPLSPIFTNYGNYFIVKLDKNGDAQCINNYPKLIEDVSCDVEGNSYGIIGAYEWWENSITISKWDYNCNHLWDVEIERELIVKIDELGNELPGINIFPNPTTSEITISGVDGIIDEISIYNKLGQRVIYEMKPDNTIDVSSLPQGLYIVEVRWDEYRVREKLIVQ